MDRGAMQRNGSQSIGRSASHRTAAERIEVARQAWHRQDGIAPKWTAYQRNAMKRIGRSAKDRSDTHGTARQSTGWAGTQWNEVHSSAQQRIGPAG